MKHRALSVLLAFVLAVSLSVPALAAEAPQYFDGHTYLLVEEPMTPVDAERYCAQRGGHLAAITSEEENQFVCRLFEDGGGSGYILGGTDREEEGTWTWMSGEPWEFTFWYPGGGAGTYEPNNGYGGGDENYLYADRSRDWHWVDFFGEYDQEQSQYPFLCEWDFISSDWAKTEIEKARDLDLIPTVLQGQDLTRPITRLEFAAVCVKVFENLSGAQALPAVVNPFTDTSYPEVLKAYNAGITVGTSATTFSPDALLDREQCATMLTRTFKRCTMPGWSMDVDSQYKLDYVMPAPFADDGNISAWARDSVYFMAANKIINGMGNNRFVPRNTTTEQQAKGYANATREQALAIAMRMVQNLS